MYGELARAGVVLGLGFHVECCITRQQRLSLMIPISRDYIARSHGFLYSSRKFSFVGINSSLKTPGSQLVAQYRINRTRPDAPPATNRRTDITTHHSSPTASLLQRFRPAILPGDQLHPRPSMPHAANASTNITAFITAVCVTILFLLGQRPPAAPFNIKYTNTWIKELIVTETEAEVDLP